MTLGEWFRLGHIKCFCQILDSVLNVRGYTESMGLTQNVKPGEQSMLHWNVCVSGDLISIGL